MKMKKEKKNPKQKSRIQLNVQPTMSNHYFSFAKVLIFIFLWNHLKMNKYNLTKLALSNILCYRYAICRITYK